MSLETTGALCTWYNSRSLCRLNPGLRSSAGQQQGSTSFPPSKLFGPPPSPPKKNSLGARKPFLIQHTTACKVFFVWFFCLSAMQDEISSAEQLGRKGAGGCGAVRRGAERGLWCLRSQRVLVGEVKIKARRCRLAPQPRLPPSRPPALSDAADLRLITVSVCVSAA